MNITQTKKDKIKILFDLKPTFDGYAGIPQETRLFFRGICTLDSCEAVGLIQHGSRKLRSAVSSSSKEALLSKRINRFSRIIVSVYEKPYESFFANLSNVVDHFFSRTLLRILTFFGLPIRIGVFDPKLFEDFIWVTFFSKTLQPADKKIVTSASYRVINSSRKSLNQFGLAGIKYSSSPKYVKLDTRGFDFFVAQTPLPARVSRGTQLIVRYHDAVPILLPHTISNKAFHQASHFYALQQNVNAGAYFSCVSEASRNDLLKIFPEVEQRSSVIHNIVSSEYYKDNSSKSLVFQVINNRIGRVKSFETNLSNINRDEKKSIDFNYLLMVSTIEPRKNHLFLLNTWERLKYTSMPNLKLVIVGAMGWDSANILNVFRPWAESSDLFYLNNVPSSELRMLYNHAVATVCPSIAEGFDYSGVEAMRCGGVVIASDIPVHREIYQNASAYFDPYSVEDAAIVIERVISANAEDIRQRLREEAIEVAKNYTSQNILPKWDAFFQMQKTSSKKTGFFNSKKS